MTLVKEEDGIGRRRVPRRTFRATAGILLAGKYLLQNSYQLGEGGMMVDFKQKKLVPNELVVLNFFLPSGDLVIVRAIVRAVIPAQDSKAGKLPERYGLEFQNLGFQHKRAIRNFVAAATRDDGHIFA